MKEAISKPIQHTFLRDAGLSHGQCVLVVAVANVTAVVFLIGAAVHNTLRIMNITY